MNFFQTIKPDRTGPDLVVIFTAIKIRKRNDNYCMRACVWVVKCMYDGPMVGQIKSDL